MEITVGSIVLYTLHEQDAEQINRRRTDGRSIADRIAVEKWPLGAQAHIGNQVKAGEQFPMLVTKIWSPGYVNGQVFLDGNDCFWATSVQEGTQGHSWSRPS
jgi:hypothetical protein